MHTLEIWCVYLFTANNQEFIKYMKRFYLIPEMQIVFV